MCNKAIVKDSSKP